MKKKTTTKNPQNLTKSSSTDLSQTYNNPRDITSCFQTEKNIACNSPNRRSEQSRSRDWRERSERVNKSVRGEDREPRHKVEVIRHQSMRLRQTHCCRASLHQVLVSPCRHRSGSSEHRRLVGYTSIHRNHHWLL